MGTKLYVGNLSFNTTEGDLLRHFEQAGTVLSCNLITDRNTHQSRGFGFVEMSSRDEANRAISEFNGEDLDGRALTVNEARPRPERANAHAGGRQRDRF